VAVKIKLKRMGKIREPYYRIIVADARTKRDGRAIEEIGKYHPKADPSLIEVNSDRAQHWLSVGAQPTDPVRKILEVTGDWQKFKGLPGAEGTLKTAAARTDKKEIFAAALAETLAESGASTKGKGRAAGARAGDAKAGGAKSDDAKAGGAKAGGAKAGGAKADDAKADDAKEGKESRSGRGGRAASAKAKSDKADADQAADAAEGGEVTAEAGGEVTAEAGGEVTAEAGDNATEAAEEAPAEPTASAEPGSGD
jgi:small subunit ribosomal protein S16